MEHAFQGAVLYIGFAALVVIAVACALASLRRVGMWLCARLSPAAVAAFAVAAAVAAGEARKRSGAMWRRG